MNVRATGRFRTCSASCTYHHARHANHGAVIIIYYVVFASADVNKILVAVIAFGLNSAAYIAEVIRSGIMSVDNGQMEAEVLVFRMARRCVSSSFRKPSRMCFRLWVTRLITLLKETSISGYIGLVDLTKGSDIIRSITYEAMMPLGRSSLPLSRSCSRTERRGWRRAGERRG